MGSKALSNRANWQMGASVTGKRGEDGFASKIAPCLPSHYAVINKPAKFAIYSDGKGVALDTYIANNESGKSILVEVKSGKNGGNAHERVYKYHMPRMRKALRGKDPTLIPESVFSVFSGRTFFGKEPFRSNSGTLVTPKKYQDEFANTLEPHLYTISDSSFTNIKEVAEKIMHLLE